MHQTQSFPKKSTIIRGLITGLALSLGSGALAQDQTPPPAVVVAPATMQSTHEQVTFTGRLVAAQQVAIRARATGFIQDVAFTEGTQIAEGDLLYQIEPDAYEAALKDVEGQLLSATAERDLADLERDRQAELVKRETSPQRNLDQAEAAVSKAEGTLITLDAQKRTAELNLSYTKITAPFAGRIGLTAFDVGALVGPDSGSLVTLTRTDKIYAEFQVPNRVLQNYLAAIAHGEASENAVVSLQLANGARFPTHGKVVFLDNEVSAGTDTILVRAVFDNPDARLRDGEFVVVVLEGADEEKVLTIPAQAISRNLAGTFVMTVSDDGTVTQKQIETGSSTQGATEVRSGLDEGELVITEGLNKVREGIKVDAATATADPAAAAADQG